MLSDDTRKRIESPFPTCAMRESALRGPIGSAVPLGGMGGSHERREARARLVRNEPNAGDRRSPAPAKERSAATGYGRGVTGLSPCRSKLSGTHGACARQSSGIGARLASGRGRSRCAGVGLRHSALPWFRRAGRQGGGVNRPRNASGRGEGARGLPETRDLSGCGLYRHRCHRSPCARHRCRAARDKVTQCRETRPRSRAYANRRTVEVSTLASGRRARR